MIMEEQSYYYQLHRSGFLHPHSHSHQEGPQRETQAAGEREREREAHRGQRHQAALGSSLPHRHSISLTGIAVHHSHLAHHQGQQHEHQSELHQHYSQELGMQQLRQAVGMGLGHHSSNSSRNGVGLGVGMGHHSNGVEVERTLQQREGQEQEGGAYFGYTSTTSSTGNGYLPAYYPMEATLGPRTSPITTTTAQGMGHSTTPAATPAAAQGAEAHPHYQHPHPHRHLPVLPTAPSISISHEAEEMFLGSGSGMGLGVVGFHLRQPLQGQGEDQNTSFLREDEDTHTSTSTSTSMLDDTTRSSSLRAGQAGVNSGLVGDAGQEEEEGTGMNGTSLPPLNTSTSMEDSSLTGLVKFEEHQGREEEE